MTLLCNCSEINFLPTILDIGGKLLIPIIIGIITFVIAKRQITNTGVTQFRQQWINTLRDTISIFISKAEYTIVQTDKEKIKEAFSELCLAQYKIEMLLNPQENDHNEIIKQIKEIRYLVYEEPEKEDKIWEEIDKLVQLSKQVLKREWAVVKKGK